MKGLPIVPLIRYNKKSFRRLSFIIEERLSFSQDSIITTYSFFEKIG